MSSRPLQNRVTPGGRIIAVRARGTLMGNRGGRIHDQTQCVIRQWASRQWISCVLDFKGRQRDVMSSGYTELFFLDEATALAAGHRPCFECRRADANAFAIAWNGGGDRARAPDMDRVLHKERRAEPDRLRPVSLPDGSFCQTDEGQFLKWGEAGFLWTPEGYGEANALPKAPCVVLTPASIRRTLANGYRPMLHPTLDANRFGPGQS